MRMHTHLAAGLLATALTPLAHAVVDAGHWALNTTPAVGNLSITVDQTVQGDYTSSFWNYNYSTGVISYVTQNADEGADIYLVHPGDVMAASPVISGARLDQLPSLAIGHDFWLGVATSSSTDPGFTWSTRTSFGWAHIQALADGSFQILGSAMAFREPGIIVGTMQAVPEPGGSALMGLGMLALAWRIRRRA